MTPEEIRKGAPDGATHCYLDSIFDVMYCKVSKDKIYIHDGVEWNFFDYTCDIEEYDLKPL